MKKRWSVAAVLLGLLIYIVAFYFAPLSSMRDSEGQPMVRTDIVAPFALHPYQGMITSWFGSPAQFTFADRLPVLATAGAILAWAFAVGRLLIMAGRIDRDLTRLETCVFSTVIGLNALSTWMLALGLLGCLSRTWVVIVPAAITFVVYAVAWHCRKRRRPSAGNENTGDELASAVSPSAGEANSADVRWLWLALPFCLAIVLTAMLPPTDFDVCAYHLQAPKEFLQQGRVSFLPHNVFANMPLGSEMLSMLAMLCMGDWWWGALAGKTVLAAFSPLCALAIFAAGRRWHSSPAGAVAAIVYISTPWVVSVSSAGLVEGVLACYTFLAIFAFMLFSAKRKTDAAVAADVPNDSTRLLALSGYLAGVAVATKYPALLFVVLPLVVAIVAGCFGKRLAMPTEATPQTGRFSRFLRTTAKHLAVFLLAAGLGCGLWFGKNWAMTGNPTYPLLYGVFGGATWNDAKDRQWNEAHRPHDFSIESLGECAERVVLTSEWISLLMTPLMALALFRKRIPVFVSALLLYAAFVILVWWLFAPRVDRFWMPMTPVLALLAGMGAYWSRERWWRRVLAGLLLLGLATSFLMVASDRENAWFLPLDPLRSDPNWISPWHRYLNQKTADSDAVLVVGTPAVFHLKPRVYYNTCFDDCILEELVKDKTPEDIRRALAAKHIAYVLVAWDAVARYRRTHGFTDFVQPEVFDRLVRQGILTPLPPLRAIDQRVYRVSQKGG